MERIPRECPDNTVIPISTNHKMATHATCLLMGKRMLSDGIRKRVWGRLGDLYLVCNETLLNGWMLKAEHLHLI